MTFKPYDGVVQWPFQFVLDADDQRTRWVLLHGPIATRTQQQQFVELRRSGCRFVGMSSYLTFPGESDSRDPLDYEMVCDAWCHCFREPERFLHTTALRALISVSDFVDYQRVSPETVAAPLPGEQLDLIYVGATEAWKREAKNWRLASRIVPRLCRDLAMRALVVGSPPEDFGTCPQVLCVESLPWPMLLGYLSRARLLFVPNVNDPSPRIITEALCMNVPILVHEKILGGWKYVNRFTGAFFKEEDDATSSARLVLNSPVAPRHWFRANYGPYQSGKRLLSLLHSIDPTLRERSHLRI